MVVGLSHWFCATDAVLRHGAGRAVFRVPPGTHRGVAGATLAAIVLISTTWAVWTIYFLTSERVAKTFT